MKAKYNIENIEKKIGSKLSRNESIYFKGFTNSPTSLNLSFNKIYTVLGIDYKSNGFVNLMIVDDTEVSYPKFYPIEFFDIVDKRTSKYWINRGSEVFSLEKLQLPKLVSFDKAVNDSYFFEDLLECKNNAHVIFEKYRLKIENEFPDDDLRMAEVIEDGWVMCSYCDEVWEVEKEDGVVICPQGHRNNNPFWTKIK